MISKNQLKQIRALGQKKQRKAEQAFLVQGEKNVLELLASDMITKALFVTADFADTHAKALTNIEHTIADEADLAKASTLVSNNAAIAIVKMPEAQEINPDRFLIALDQVSDPGNLGTIIRLADWYGIKQVVLSANCADPYNPKTISATMGSFTRVECIQTNLVEFLAAFPHPKYGAFLQGENVHKTEFGDLGVLVMGSESHGISAEAESFITDKVTIPSFGGAESLNVAIATGIILDNVKRSQ